MDPSAICISVITWFELIYGVKKSQNPNANYKALQGFIIPFEVSPWTQKAATLTGEIRAKLEKIGAPIGPFDSQIAGHALSLDLTLVTNNESEFRRLPNLKVENWSQPTLKKMK